MKKFVVIAVAMGLILIYGTQFSLAIVLSNIENESPTVWGISINDKYIPQRGGIKVCKAENNVVVGFYLSDDNINFYKQTFSDERRKPMGFEMDIIDHSGVFNRDDLVSITTHGFSSDLIYLDNYQLDGGNNYTLAINNPSELEANKWYTVTFHFNKHIEAAIATYEVQVQLVGDVYTLKNDFTDIYESYSFAVKSEFAAWFAMMSDLDGNNFFNIRSPRGSLFYRDKFFAWPEGSDTGYDRFLWYIGGPGTGQIGDYKPYSCGFGFDPWKEEYEVENPGEESPDPDPEIINPGTTGGGGMNDMKMKGMTLAKGANSERHSTLYQDPGEKFYAFAKIKNSGSAIAYDFKIKWYIDAGKRNFNREEKDYQGSIRIDEFNPDAEIRYAKELTSPDEPGVYWVYACITSIDNDEDEGNNCADEDDREEYGKLVIEGPYEMPIEPSVPTGKSWNELTSGEKAAVLQIILD